VITFDLSFSPGISYLLYSVGGLPWAATPKLMQRLLEIQSGGREISPELMLEDERLMNSLQQETLVKSSTTQAARIVLNCREQMG
jgi:hypothetical protein